MTRPTSDWNAGDLVEVEIDGYNRLAKLWRVCEKGDPNSVVESQREPYAQVFSLEEELLITRPIGEINWLREGSEEGIKNLAIREAILDSREFRARFVPREVKKPRGPTSSGIPGVSKEELEAALTALKAAKGESDG